MADLNNQQSNSAPESQPQQPAPQVAAKVDIADQATQIAGNVQGSVDQAKKAAQDVSGQLMGGMDQLKKVDVTNMFKPASGQPAVTQYEKLLGGVSYIPLAPIGTLIIKGDSNYVKLHGRQSLVLTVIFILCIFLYVIPYIGVWLAGVIQFAIFVLGVFSMYQAFVGNWWKIPILGDIADMIPIGFFVQVAKEAVTGQPQKAESAKPETAESQEPATLSQPPVENPPIPPAAG
jgi:uncharacterized membrane protein